MKIQRDRLIALSMITMISLSFTACTKAPAPTPQPRNIEHHTQGYERQQQITRQQQIARQEREAKKNQAYKNAMREVGAIIKSDSNYRRLNLSTIELKNWFTDVTFKVWDHQISKRQFISMGLEKFPDHAYEFNLIATELMTR
jgi:hypothetical protein